MSGGLQGLPIHFVVSYLEFSCSFINLLVNIFDFCFDILDVTGLSAYIALLDTSTPRFIKVFMFSFHKENFVFIFCFHPE